VAEWVREGGAVIVAPAHEPRDRARPFRGAGGRRLLERETSILEELGLGDVWVSEAEGEPAQDPLDEWPTRRPVNRPQQTLAVHAEGELGFLEPLVHRVRVPRGRLQTIRSSQGTASSGRLRARVEETKEEQILVALYPVGRGQVIVVGEPGVFQNEFLARDDNAVLAAHLFHYPERPVLFDEFYHGLTVRGNPVWLLGRYPYGLLAALVLLASALWAWRAGARLGPPLPERSASRRSVGEYVEAMARLFHRTGDRLFVLREFRDGALWALRRRLHLGPKQEHAAELVRALARKDPAAAQRLLEAANEAEAVLAGMSPGRTRGGIGDHEAAATRAARKLGQCL
jgi:hypothetical protein